MISDHQNLRKTNHQPASCIFPIKIKVCINAEYQQIVQTEKENH